MQKRRRPAWVKDIAKRFINRMISLAEETEDTELSRRYVEIALKACKKYNVRLPLDYKRKICKNCYAILIPGKTALVRISKGVAIWICKECGHVKRIGSKKEGQGAKTPGKDREGRANRRSHTGDKKAPRHKRVSEDKGSAQ